MTRADSVPLAKGAVDAGHGDRETRDRLLRAAERLFAQRGFKDVTVREICHAAHANVAAVNYHFGDKLGLYRETMQLAIDAMREATESARRAGEGLPPDQQLRAYISLFLRRLLAPGHESVHQLVNREIGDPTPALDELVEQGMRPRLEYLSGVVAGILGCDPKDQRVLRCVMSVQAQSIIYARPNAVAERLGFKFRPTPAQIDEAASHIADFSIAGIRAIGQTAGGIG
jgi:TetR/AcrR family transcriptional regulator, regulator of cefoperazone and chloramphenicol sensitivity